MYCSNTGRQEAVEEAQKEIAALSKYQEDVKKREQELLELEKQREAVEKEREELGVTWGMGMCTFIAYSGYNCVHL